MKNALSTTGRLQDIIKKCRKISTYFNHSSKASNKLTEFQTQNGFPNHKLKQQVETRWNSTFFMLERYLEQRKVVSMTLEWFDKGELNLDTEEVKEIELAVESLRPFEEVTTDISAEKQPTLSKIGPIIQDIIESLEQNQQSEIRDHLHQEMKSRFEDILDSNKEISTSTFLDPRLRDIYFSNKRNTGYEIAKEEILSLMQNDTVGLSNKKEMKQEEEASRPTTSNEKRGFMKRLFSKSEEIKATQKNKSVDKPTLEMQRFMDESIVDLEINLLQWWRDNEALFPLLKKIAKRYLCIPATSVPSERLFSKAGEVVSHKRNGLSGKNVNMILFCNNNIDM